MNDELSRTQPKDFSRGDDDGLDIEDQHIQRAQGARSHETQARRGNVMASTETKV